MDLMSETIILVLIIWVAIVTIICIILLIVLCCLLRRKDVDDKQRKNSTTYNDYLDTYHNTLPKTKTAESEYVNTNGMDIQVMSDQGENLDGDVDRSERLESTKDHHIGIDWIGSMREDEFADYAMDTIQREASKKKKESGGLSEPGNRLTVSKEEINNY